MKKLKATTKRGFALFLALLMCLSTVNLSVLAVDDAPELKDTSKEVFTCGLEEHTHTDACYVSESQNPEDPSMKDEDPVQEPEIEEPAEEPLPAPPAANEDAGDTAGSETDPEQADDSTPDIGEDGPSAEPVEEPQENGEEMTDEESLPGETPVVEPSEEVLSENTDVQEGEITAAPDAPAESAPAETEEPAEEPAEAPAPVCGLEEHVHTLACTHYAELAEALEVFGPKAYNLYGSYLEDPANLDEYGDLTEEATMAFMEEAAATLGEEFNALVDLYQTIPSCFLNEEDPHFSPECQATVATLEVLAGMLGGDLDSGIMVLAVTVTVNSGNLSDVRKAINAGKDVNVTKTITVTGDQTLDLMGHTITYTGDAPEQDGKKIDSVFVVQGKFTLKDSSSTGSGKITGGKGSIGIAKYDKFQLDANNKSAGGGVFVCTNATFTMYGGSITGNTAGRGGGIYVDKTSGATGKLNIYGGSITDNTATACETAPDKDGKVYGNVNGGGGGMWINGDAVIDPTANGGSNISITGNRSMTTGDLGGGGIYVNNDGTLTIYNAVVTGNTATGLGGGLAGCNHSKISLVSLSPGAAIYGNAANGAPLHRKSTVVDHFGDWQTDEDFIKAAKDIFTASTPSKLPDGDTDVSHTPDYTERGTVIGNGMGSDWVGYVKNGAAESFHQVKATQKEDIIYGRYLLGLTATKQAAVGGNYVDISGNTSAAHGGGIACNGIINSFSNTAAKELNGDIALTVQKTLEGVEDWGDQTFQFELLDVNRELLDTKTVSGEATKATFNIGKYVDVNNLSSSYTFYVKEAAEPADSNVTYATNEYTIRFKVVPDEPATRTHVVKNVNGTTYNVVVSRYKIDTPTVTQNGTPVTVTTQTKDSSYVNESGGTVAYKITNYAANLPFTNTWKTDGQLTIRKDLVSPTLAKKGEKFTFQITLEDKSGNGIHLPNGKYGDVEFKNGAATVVLEVTEDGEAPASETITGLPVGLSYTVTETGMATGYVGHGEITKTGTIVSGNTDVTITNERSTASLSVQKKVTWDGQQSKDPEKLTEQPFTVVVTLGDENAAHKDVVLAENLNDDGTYKFVENGKYTFTLNPGNGNGTAGEAATISGIPTGTPYTVVETKDGMPTGYSYKSGEVTKATELKVDSSVTVENRYFKTKTTSLSVTKDWGQTPTEYKPASILVQLFQGDQAHGDPVALTSTGWSHTWNDLPLYASEGNAYTYSVKELSDSDHPFTFPEGSTLRADTLSGNVIRVRNTANEGKDGNYEIVGGWLVNNGDSLTVVSNGKITIQNTWLGADQAVQGSITIHKVDADNENLRIPNVTFTLTKDDANVIPDGKGGREFSTGDNGDDITFLGLTQGTYTLEETVWHEGYLKPVDTWQIKVGKGDVLQSVTPMNDDGELGKPVGNNTWYWDADNAMGETRNDFKWEVSEGGLTGVMTIKNQVIKGDLQITKYLNLDGKENQTLSGEPADKTFTFTVYAEDVFGLAKDTVVGTLNIKAGETGENTILKGLRYGTYRIEETGDSDLTDYKWDGITLDTPVAADNPTVGNPPMAPVPGNSLKVSVNEKTTETIVVTAVNYYTRDTGDLTVRKTVSGNRGDQSRDWHFNVALTSEMGYVDLRNYDYTYSIYETNDDGSIRVDENGAQVLAKDADGKALADGATLGFAVPAASVEPPAGPLEGNDEVTAAYNGTVTATITLKHNQIAVIEGIPVGVTYAVTEVEANTDGYTTTMEGANGGITKETTSAASFENYNNYNRPNTVNLNVRKVWVGDEAANRPASVTVVLYRNGDEYERVELNAGNNWRHSWNGLDRAADWTLEEDDVPAGYTSAVTQEGVSFTVTNTYTPDEDTEIPDEDTPLAELPEDDVPLAELPESDVPLTELPEEEIPLAEVPQTGENMYGWYLLTVLAVVGFVSLQILTRKKHKGDEK